MAPPSESCRLSQSSSTPSFVSIQIPVFFKSWKYSPNEEPSFDHETDLSRESPPPYSEVDPLKKSTERPNSLDLSSETTAQESLASPQENAQTNEGTAGAYTIVIHDKDLCSRNAKGS